MQEDLVPPRKGIRAEREYAATAEAILTQARENMVSIMEAFLQRVSWMRQCDLRPQDLELAAHAQRYVDAHRKKIA